jgi:methylenetetrahydrofolate reductase (NADPH)
MYHSSNTHLAKSLLGIFMSSAQRYSFEFFPPKTDEGRIKLRETRRVLNALGPSFFSVTYGAGGSTRDNTQNIISEMRAEGLSVAPHLSFGSDDGETILAMLKNYQVAGVDRIVALRGDAVSGAGAQKPVYAKQLIEFIRQHTGDHFHLEIAAYPEIHPDASIQTQQSAYDFDIQCLKEKFAAGGNSAITQYFYNADAYFFFVDACKKAGIDQPIYPGIMPITNFQNLARFSRNCGADIPRWLSKKLEAFGDDTASITAYGIDVVTQLCETLLAGGAPGLHFYTMNQIEPSATIWRNLRLPSVE